MGEIVKRVLKMSKKGCKRYLVKGCLVTTAATFAIVIAICLLMLRACTSGPTLNKDQIIQFVLDNEELLNQAVEEVWGLDEYVSRIAHTGFTRLHRRDEFDFEGLYTGGVIGSEYVIEPLYNPVLYELLGDGRIRSIAIRRNNLTRGTTYQIQFAFNVRTTRYRHGGIYFSKNDVPILFDGRVWRNPEVYRNGWVSYGQSFYVTERVVPHWFYYEMLFSSSRTPSR